MAIIKNLPAILLICGCIVMGIGISQLPSTGGSVPPNQDIKEFQAQQKEMVIHSTGFITAMIGSTIAVISLLYISAVNYCNERREIYILPITPSMPIRQKTVRFNLPDST
jgi:hypothetical protein